MINQWIGIPLEPLSGRFALIRRRKVTDVDSRVSRLLAHVVASPVNKQKPSITLWGSCFMLSVRLIPFALMLPISTVG